MKKSLISNLVAVIVLCTLCITDLNAQLVAGKVYQILNKADSGIALGVDSDNHPMGVSKIDVSATNPASYRQLWVAKECTGNNIQLVNVSNGLYLAGNTISAPWSMTDENTLETTIFEQYTSGGYFSLRSVAHKNVDYYPNYAYMHKDGARNIVGWTAGADNTLWVANEVAVDGDAFGVDMLKSLLDEVFIDADGACLTLNDKYNEMSESELMVDGVYKSLPAALQLMVKKVHARNWSEVNADSSKDGWDSSHAKRFRVQMYEPYSVAGNITSFLKINAHARPFGLSCT